MEGKYLVVKVKNDQAQIIRYLRDSLSRKCEHFYNIISEADIEATNRMEAGDKYGTVFIIFSTENDTYNAEEILIGSAHIHSDQQRNLKYKIKGSTSSEIVVKNFIINSGIDLKNDFVNFSYITIETFTELMKQLEFAIDDVYSVNPISYEDQVDKYQSIARESSLNELSQMNQHCRRAISAMSISSHRSEFQRDRERVVHAKAFRRLVDKAQIFTSTKGDHFRTRMTHTLEVSQIARSLAQQLNLNVDLTEAIALAHDIGHTPFGHQGERTLNDILRGKIRIIKDADRIDFGGFKHNFHGLRVLSYLEEKYIEYEGIDLSYQVLEGVLKHTKVKHKQCGLCNERNCTSSCEIAIEANENEDIQQCYACTLKTCKRKCYDVSEFLINGEEKYLFLKYKFATTIEGQIVNISDEIAQRGHDLDDAFASGHISFEELLSYAEINKMAPIKQLLANIKDDTDFMEENNRVFIDKNDMFRSRLVSAILGYFMDDVIQETEGNMNRYVGNEDYERYHRIHEELVKFSPNGKFIVDYLERLISRKVINSFEVARFDDKAQRVITELFEAYYRNPKLLPDGTLKRIYKSIRKISNNVIDFRNGNPDLIIGELNSICNGDIPIENGEIDINSELYKKRKILVRCIVDHIAGMTDNFALNEYKSLISDR